MRTSMLCLLLLAGSAQALGHAPSLLSPRASALFVSERAAAGHYDRSSWSAELPAPALAQGGRVLLAQDDAQPPPPSAYSDWRAALVQEKAQLEADRPGLGAPIGMLVGGFVGAYVGLVAAEVGLAIGFSSSNLRTTSGERQLFMAIGIAGVVLLAAGIALAVVGGIKLGRAIYTRVKTSRRISQIDDQLQSGGSFGAPPDEAAPPVQSVPTVDRLLPAPGFALASF